LVANKIDKKVFYHLKRFQNQELKREIQNILFLLFHLINKEIFFVGEKMFL